MIGTNYESIMGVFTKTVEKLNVRASKLKGNVDERQTRITALQQQNFADQHEQALCMNAAKKIGDLL